jgi:hypothetical protein
MAAGGFDVVLGNPPWEKANIKYEEFFKNKEPSILELKNDDERERAIEALKESRPTTYSEYRCLRDSTDRRIGFIRNSGFLKLTSNGSINYYSGFAELMLNLMNATSRAGMILQSGISTDKTNEEFFRQTLMKNNLVSLFDFINTEKIFDIDPRVKFSLMSLSREHDQHKPKFAFNLTNPIQTLRSSYELTFEDISIG